MQYPEIRFLLHGIDLHQIQHARRHTIDIHRL